MLSSRPQEQVMYEILVWVLISVSMGGNNRGDATALLHFKSEAQCEHVKANLPEKGSLTATCIQAIILVPK